MEAISSNGLIMFSDTSSVFAMLPDAPKFETVLIKNEIKNTQWAPWGSDNLLGNQLAQRIAKCGVLVAGIESKARIAIGKGLQPVLIDGVDAKTGKENIEFVFDQEINDWLEANSTFDNSLNTILNFIGKGWTHDRFVLSGDGSKIASWLTDDVVKCRLGRYDDSGVMPKTFIAADWTQINQNEEDGKYVKEVTLLREKDEYNHLLELAKGATGPKEFSMISRGHLNGNTYYPTPLWYSAVQWVDLVIAVPTMKVAMMKNQMTIKYVITINEKYFIDGDDKWESYTAEEKNKKFEEKATEINKCLSGNDKAYKSIVSKSFIDPRTNMEMSYIKVEVLDDKVKDGKLLVDSGAGNKEILFSLMMNPAINGANTFGADYSGGAGSGSDIREAYLVQIMLMEAERQMVSKRMDLVKRYNKWDKKYSGKNLQFRFPNLILTTLDTGGSTAPVNP